MIRIFYETDFKLENESLFCNWIKNAIQEEGFSAKEINYIFCSDEYLLDINIQHLQHDYYTDVIGFQYSVGRFLTGDIFISLDRIKENAIQNQVLFQNELARVMIHGVLHFMDYKDSSENEKVSMRKAEDRYLEKLKF